MGTPIDGKARKTVLDGTERVAISSGAEGSAVDRNAQLQDIANLAVTDFKENVSTGLLYGGEVSINADPTKFDIAAGKGIIVDAYTDPENPVITELEWTAQTAVSVDNIATQLVTFVSISDAGGGVAQFTQSGSGQTNADNRDKIEIAVLVHTNLTTISRADGSPNWLQDTTLKLDDLSVAVGTININDGNCFRANGTDLKIKKTAGEMLNLNGNYNTDKQTPNNILTPEQLAITFLTGYLDGTTIVGSSSDIDTSQFNPYTTGGLEPLKEQYYSVHFIYFSPTLNETFVIYGQYQYDSLKKAVDSWDKEAYNKIPELAGVPLRAALAFKKDATDLSDPLQAKFIDVGAFGQSNNKIIESFSRFAESVEIVNGLYNDEIDITLVESGGTIYAEVERDGGGDVTFYFEQREYILDCITGAGTGGKARIALTAGSSTTVTAENWLYAIRNNDVAELQVSSSRPTGEFSYIWQGELPNVAGFLVDNAHKSQRHNDAKSFDGRSQTQRDSEWIRTRPAEYNSGMTQTVTVDTVPSPDSIDYSQTTGSAWQKHLTTNIQSFQISVDGIRIANHPTTPGLQVFDLNDSNLLQDSSGNSLVNQSFNWVIWLSVGYKGTSQLWINLPTAADSSSNAAVSKLNNSDTTIPTNYKSVGVLVSQLPFSHSNAGGGTYTNLAASLLGLQVIDLRGQPAGSTTGGGASPIVNEFLDSLFRIIDDVSGFKIQFLADNLTADRAYNLPDVAGTLVQYKTNTIASASSVTPTGDAKENEQYVTALAANLTINAPSGTAVNGNNLIIRIEDNGTARTLTWNAIYEAVGVTLPTTTTISKKLYIGCIYNSTDVKWDVVSVVEEA